MSQQARWDNQSLWRMGVGVTPRRWVSSPALAFVLAFAGTLAVALLLQGEKPFYNDSSHFWSVASSLVVNGNFSLLNFQDGASGYSLAVINYALQSLAADFAWTSSFVVKLFAALTFASIGSLLAPAYVRTVWPTQPSWSVARRLVLTALLIVFWSGFLNFPLSDFPGLAMALLTLVAVARSDSPGWMFVAGAALAISLNMRAAYTPLVPVVGVLVAWTWFEQRGAAHASIGRRALCAGLLLVGFAIVSLPQSLSAHRYYGTWSFVPGAAQLNPGSVYSSGMPYQAIDTYVVGNGQSVAMVYDFPPGQRLLDEQKGATITTTAQYIGLLASHPLVTGDEIARRIINGLDPLYSTPYIENIHNYGRVWGRIAGFLLLFIALLRLLWPAARRRLGPGRLRYLVALALCTVTTLSTGMERRYMLPIYLIVYALVLMPGWPNPIGEGGGLRRYRTPAVILAALLAFTAVVWYVTNTAIDQIHFIQ